MKSTSLTLGARWARLCRKARLFQKARLLAAACLVAGALAGAARAQNAPVPPEIEDLSVTQIGKEAPHATLMPYATPEQALAGKRRESPFARDLNGQWKFNWVKRPELRPVDFYKPDFDVSAWKAIPVPSCWQTEGYGTPYYRNSGYTFKVDPPHVMSEPPREYTAYDERNPVGSYRRDFEVPADWAGRRVFITFDGVDSAFYLWINGEKVGYSTDSRTPAEWDITKYLKPGKNVLAAEVYRYSTGSYLEDQDMYRLSGIFRNVTLWSAPQVHIRDFFALPDLDQDYKNGTLTVTAKVKNYGPTAAPAKIVRVALFDPDGKMVQSACQVAQVPALAPGEEATVKVTGTIPNPIKWTAETPILYTTGLALANASGSLMAEEMISCRTGFRKVEIKGRIYMINGVPVKLKGTNRHENWPDTGHTVSEERMIKDIELIKGCNCNHVRTCHYSDDPRWYELCDEYGLYLTAEANIESHGYRGGRSRSSGDASAEERFAKAHLYRTVNSIERDKNHAAVVMWSMGNEAGGGPNFLADMKAIKALDTSRPVHYQGFGIGERNPADVDSSMYPAPSAVEKVARDSGRYTKPYYLCEYAHAMNNSMGAICDYNEIIDRNPEVMGAAIWEWQDQALWNRRDPDPKKHFLAYGGDFGDIPNNGLFILKGVVFADRTPTPKYAEVKKAYQWMNFTPEDLAADKPFTIKVYNKYQFTNLNKFGIKLSFTEDGVEVANGSAPPLDLAPLTTGTLKLGVPDFKPDFKIKPGAEYILRVALTLRADELWAKRGFEVASAQFKLPIENKSAPARLDPAATAPTLKVEQTEAAMTIVGQTFRVTFSRADGAIRELSYGGRKVLVAGPRLNVWRAPHMNDDLWAARAWENYGLAALTAKDVSLSAKSLDGGVCQVLASLKSVGQRGMAFEQRIAYLVLADGTIMVDETVDPSGPEIVLPRLGMRMYVDKSLDHFTYYGRGPSENYPDRKRGSDVGRYASSVKDQLTPYAKPMECGNHEDVRWAALTGADGAGVIAIADVPMSASALPHDDEALDVAKHPCDLAESTSTALCLSAGTLGVGSGACGPRPLEQYTLYSRPAAFSYVLRPVAAGTKDLGELARQPLPAHAKPVVPVHDAKASGNRAGRKLWRATASSVQSGEGEARNAIDDDPLTFWHSQYKPRLEKFPHWLTVDLGAPTKLKGVVYSARTGARTNGRVKDYELYLSQDGQAWGAPVAKGQFNTRAAQQTIALEKPAEARYLKLVAKSEATGKDYASIAELNIIPAGE